MESQRIRCSICPVGRETLLLDLDWLVAGLNLRFVKHHPESRLLVVSRIGVARSIITQD